MAVKTVQYIIDGQTYNLTFDASTGEYKARVLLLHRIQLTAVRHSLSLLR